MDIINLTYGLKKVSEILKNKLNGCCDEISNKIKFLSNKYGFGCNKCVPLFMYKNVRMYKLYEHEYLFCSCIIF